MTADTKPLTYRVDLGAPLDLRGYESREGYAAVRKALREMQPSDVTHLVKEANLRGRGGAGFPTGVKWGLVPMGETAPRHKYLLCNADEMEPGTFKDRLLLEGAPHQLVEAMIVSAYAIQASHGYIFVRGEYVLAAERLERAIAEARIAGYLGANVLGSPWSFELFVHTGAGRYIPGEETALINSLEGRRANPRAKPPFPQIAGLWGKPTVVNNVETLCNVPHIVMRGAEWFHGLSQGKTKDSGTKLYGVSGRVKRPGPLMVPMPVELSAVKYTTSDEMDAYERLLTDAMKGDQLLFVRQDAVEAAWAIVDPILGDCCPTEAYEPGTWGPPDSRELAADIGGWHDPE